MLGWLWWQLDGLYGHTHRLYSHPLRTVANTSLVEGIHWLTMVLSALLDQSSAALGPTLCPEMTRGQRTFCYTILQIGESDKASLCRDTKALCRGRRVCELESSHALAMKQCVCWGGTELPRNTVGNIAFLSMVFTGTQSGNILLIISSLYPDQLVLSFLFLHSTTERAGTVKPQSGPQLEQDLMCPRGLQVPGQTDGSHNLELLYPHFLYADPPD